MRISNTYRFQQPQVLKGLFKNEKAIYRAQEVLTDFGYPRDAASITEVDGKWHQFKAHSKHAINLVISRFLTGMIAGAAIAVVAGVISQTRYYSMAGFLEGVLLLIAWSSFVLIGALICGFIGALLMTIIYSFFAEEYEDSGKARAENVLISVAVRTPADAEDIAREWEEIGGKVV